MGMDRTPIMNSGNKAVILIEVHALSQERLEQFDDELQRLLDKSDFAVDPNQPPDSPRRRKPRRLVTLVTGVPPLPASPPAPQSPAAPESPGGPG